MNRKGKRIQEKEFMKRKEWLEYIDKLIARESSKYNRIGITIWVIIAALAILLINIIDILYQIPSLDNEMLIDLYCLYSTILISFYIIISAFKPQLNRYKDFFPSRIDANRNYLMVVCIFFITAIMCFSTKTFKLVYVLIGNLLIQYMQSNSRWYLTKRKFIKIYLFFYKIYIFNLKMKYFYRIIILLLCLFLYIFDYKTIFVSVGKETVLFSLFSYTFIFLSLLLSYLLIGDFALQYLKQLENNIIMDLIKEKDIKKYFKTYFIGHDIKKIIDEENILFNKTLDAFEFEEKLFSRKLNEMISNPDTNKDNNMDELYSAILKMRDKLMETNISMMNQLVHYIFRKLEKDVIKDQNDSLRRMKKIIKDINSRIKKIRTFQKNQKNKKSEIFSGTEDLDIQT